MNTIRPMRTLCCLVVACLWGQVALAAPRPGQVGEQPAAKLRRLLTNLPTSGAVCGASIVDLRSGDVLFAINAERPMLPASNAKLFALAASIDGLGADFEFRTVLARRGRDLVVVGDGDPSLGDPKLAEENAEAVTAMFDRWVDAMLRSGLRRVEGDLVIDESIFDDQSVHPGWAKGDLKKWYGAPVGALNFNDNCVDVTIRPASDGEPALWDVLPPAPIVTIVNRCESGGAGSPVIDRRGLTFEYVLTGRCQQRVTLQPVAVPDPGLFFASALRAALSKRGIAVAGETRRQRVRDSAGTLPADLELIAEHRTPLSVVTVRAGKNSQNLFAECLFKRLGYEWAKRNGHAHPLGSWGTGRAAVEEFLARAGVDAAGLVVADASGLSRANRATAAACVQLLLVMHEHPGWETFVRSLSVAGRDGSLRKRMKDVPGLVCAKTGYLRGVRTLSGYVETANGRMVCFSVLFNGFKGPTAPYNRIHDEVCRILATWPGDVRLSKDGQ